MAVGEDTWKRFGKVGEWDAGLLVWPPIQSMLSLLGVAVVVYVCMYVCMYVCGTIGMASETKHAVVAGSYCCCVCMYVCMYVCMQNHWHVL